MYNEELTQAVPYEECGNCKTEKPISNMLSGECKKCRYHVCMFKGCDKAYAELATLKKHLPSKHNTEKSRVLLYPPEKYCFCGELKIREPGQKFDKCEKCGRFWCTVGNCSSDFSAIWTLRDHTKICPEIPTEYTNKCFGCSERKVRDGVHTSAICPNKSCQRRWCLVKFCAFEHTDERSLRGHFAMLHKQLVIKYKK